MTEVNGHDEESSRTLREIIDLGYAAADALNSPMYQLANKIATDQIMMDWVNTEPKEVNKREALWQEMQAHGRINAVMHTYVERARQQLQAQRDEDSDQQRLDEQGFGLQPGYGQVDDFEKLQ